MLSFLDEIWPHIAGGLTLLVTVTASGHAVLHKRDARSAVAWVGVIPSSGLYSISSLGLTASGGVPGPYAVIRVVCRVLSV